MLLLAIGLIRRTSADLAGVTLATDMPSVGERIKRLLVPAQRAEIEQQVACNGEPACNRCRTRWRRRA